MFSRPEERTDVARPQRPDSELTGNEVAAARAGTPESVLCVAAAPQGEVEGGRKRG